MKYFSEDPNDWAKSGIIGIEVDLAWHDLPLPERLEAIIEEHSERIDDSETAFTLPFLSAIESPKGVWCRIHGHVMGGQLSFIRINLERKPTDPAPSRIVKLSERLGGYPEGLKTVLDTLRGCKGVCDADARLAFPMSPLKFKRREFSYDVQPFILDCEMLEFTSPDGSRAEIVMTGDDAVIKIAFEFELEIGMDSFEKAASVLREKILPFEKK